MFPPTKNSKLAQRLQDALRLTRSFLLLEDDREVDWEVDQDERGLAIHPHRRALRGPSSVRRPGQPPGRQQLCLCPIEPSAARAPGRAHRQGAQQPPRQPSGRSSDKAGRHEGAIRCPRGEQARRA